MIYVMYFKYLLLNEINNSLKVAFFIFLHQL